MDKLKSLVKKFEAKAGDHPNASSDPNINPTSGVRGNGPAMSDTKAHIAAGEGGHDPADGAPRAGSTTSSDTVSAGVASGTIERS
ncbi:hypothetical protein Slin15195_G039430 [Septoria linicola]|uniref:Uncharacterized protein n=1 Tax=Septoria linicola TaxID=215465 RepID=A0A9Q9EI19_9PEZI|nr:hypothetical protein Slin14017_G120850 [Septoria linicola]USW50624.1 hypothetical protein Slin15195_G039430 [Septoria linicola]